MRELYLVRIPVRHEPLVRFLIRRKIGREDGIMGYAMHVWLCALFGGQPTKPFRYFGNTMEVLAYSPSNAVGLLQQAREFAQPDAWAALDPDGVKSKPMPERWTVGRRIGLEVMACPASRGSGEEKDVYLRALEQLGPSAPTRGEVYQEWLKAKLMGAVQLNSVDLLGVRTRVKLLRSRHDGTNRLRVVERPCAIFRADGVIADEKQFSELIARGIGRHRTFGFGMLLLLPPR